MRPAVAGQAGLRLFSLVDGNFRFSAASSAPPGRVMEKAINPLTHGGHPFIYAGMNADMDTVMNMVVFPFVFETYI
jgi:hypothetical protein